MIILRKRLRRFYIVSQDSNLEKNIISPAVPNNFLSRGGYWDNKTPRIRIYNTLRDAISATFLGQKLRPGTKLYVYEAINLHPESLIGPVGLDKVPYFRDISEWWYLRNCSVKFIAEIEIGDLKKTLEYKYGPRQTIAPIYRWGWSEVIPKYQEKFGPKLQKEKYYSDPLENLSPEQLDRFANRVVAHRKETRLQKKKLQDAKINTLASGAQATINRTSQDEATIRAKKLLDYQKAKGAERNVLKKELINTIRNDNT